MDQVESDTLKRPSASGEGSSLHSKPLENGDKQVPERALLLLGGALPTGVTHNTRARQAAISQKLHVLEVAAILESKVLPSGRNNRIVPGKMKTTRG